MNEKGMMVIARLLHAAMLAAAMLVAQNGYAQDALPNTPPELKDFKLDPEKKPAEPKPEAKMPVIELPQIKPAAAASAQSAAPGTSTPKRPPEQTRNSASPPKSDKTETPAVVPPATEQAVSASDLPTAVTPPVGAMPDFAPATQPVTTPESAFEFAKLNWWAIAASLGLAALSLLGIAAWRRRRRAFNTVYDEAEMPAVVSEPLVEPLAEPVTEPTHDEVLAPVALPVPPPIAAPLPIAPVSAAKRPQLDVSFIPTKATVSVANLTINGQLRIINQGEAVAKSMGLRSILISASEIQNDVIAAFHGDKAAHFVEHLGEAGPGERIAMDIELTIPLAELRSYPLGDQRLFVPIVLADIEYAWGKKGQDETRLSCLIGREATPPKPKMGPLRLDLGPRSFSPLGQRPVFG